MAIWRSKAARAQKCRVEHFRTVSGRHDDHWRAGVSLESINFGQQLIEGLLPLVVAAQAYDSSPALTNGINLVNENDRWSCLARLLEQVSDPCCPDPHKHLNELGAAGLEECDLGLAGRGFGQQCLACARWADQQYSLGDMPTELRELLGRLQELDDLLELRNGFIRAADIFVCNRNILGLDLDRFALADPKDATEPWACGPARSPYARYQKPPSNASGIRIRAEIRPWGSVGARTGKLPLRFVTLQSAWGRLQAQVRY